MEKNPTGSKRPWLPQQLGVAIFTVALTCVAFGSSSLRGQTASPSAPQGAAQDTAQSAAQGALPSFEVASVKPDHSGTMARLFQTPSIDRFHTINMPAKMLIVFAYDIKPGQLSGGPPWIDSQGYEIDAKIDDSLIPQFKTLSDHERFAQIRLMLRSLLADRFKLVLSQSTKEMPVYELVVAKGGAKLTPTKFKPPDNGAPLSSLPPQSQPHLLIGPGSISGVNQPMSGLADVLSLLPDLGGRVVQDRTGIQGNYDFELKFTMQTPFPNMPAPPAPADDSAPPPSLFTALQEQLGLRLESTKGNVDTYTIEHIEEPSEN